MQKKSEMHLIVHITLNSNSVICASAIFVKLYCFLEHSIKWLVTSHCHLFGEVSDGQAIAGHAINADDVESSLFNDRATHLYQPRSNFYEDSSKKLDYFTDV